MNSLININSSNITNINSAVKLSEINEKVKWYDILISVSDNWNFLWSNWTEMNCKGGGIERNLSDDSLKIDVFFDQNC